MLPCWSGEILPVAFAIDCHDREVFAWTASPRPLTGADIRTLMDKALWTRFGEATFKAPYAIQWLSDNRVQPAEQWLGRGGLTAQGDSMSEAAWNSQ